MRAVSRIRSGDMWRRVSTTREGDRKNGRTTSTQIAIMFVPGRHVVKEQILARVAKKHKVEITVGALPRNPNSRTILKTLVEMDQNLEHGSWA